MTEDRTRARQQSIGDIPRRSAARFPHKLAVVHRDVRLTFAEFDAVIDRVAAALHAEGLTRGDRLALLSHNCWQYPVLNFATARLGVVLVPINFMLTGGEIGYILDDCAADAFVVEDALVPVAETALTESKGSVRVRAAIPLAGAGVPDGWVSMAGWTDGEFASPPEVFVPDDDVVRIMYTSGTESRPKGAMLTSRSLMWQYISCIVTGGMSSDDVEVHALPLYHCAQLDNFLSTDIYLGATSIIVDGPDPRVLLRTIETERVTNLFCPPTVWISLLQSPDFEHTDLRSLRKGYYGASPLPLEILREMNRRLPASGCGTSTGRRRWRRSRRLSGRKIKRHAAVRRGSPLSTWRRGSWTTATCRSPRARSARSCTAARTPPSAISGNPRRPRKRSRAAGFTPATSATSTRTDTSGWSTARRT